MEHPVNGVFTNAQHEGDLFHWQRIVQGFPAEACQLAGALDQVGPFGQPASLVSVKGPASGASAAKQFVAFQVFRIARRRGPSKLVVF